MSEPLPMDVLLELEAGERAAAARSRLVDLLELEPMGTRPDGRATWDDVIVYTAKALDSRKMAHAAVKRRTAQVAAALDLPEGTSWPEVMAELVRVHARAEAG